MNTTTKALLPLLAIGGATNSIAAHAAEQPNIVMLFVDDLGWNDLGFRNPQFQTPNINALKEKSLNFERAYVPTATSSPSRVALLTGKESLRCGFVRHIYDEAEETEFQLFERDPRQMKSRGYMPHDEVTYAERLTEYGYTNYHVGKWHLGYEDFYPETHGFDHTAATAKYGHPKTYYYPFFDSGSPVDTAKKGDYITDLVADAAVEYIKEAATKTEPFLLNTWFYTVHGPHIGKKELVEKYKALGMATRLANYHAMVESLDIAVGRIMESLEQEGVAENTIILFSSDQGGMFDNSPLSGGKLGGNTLGEGGSRVPLLIYSPLHKTAGESYSSPVQTIDIYPTLIELASGKSCSDKWINGVSLIPTLKGKSLKSRDLFLHRSYEDQHAAIIRDEWKLIKYTSGKLELFNIDADQSESTNLINVEPKLAEKMLKRLNAWIEDATPKELLSQTK